MSEGFYSYDYTRARQPYINPATGNWKDDIEMTEEDWAKANTPDVEHWGGMGGLGDMAAAVALGARPADQHVAPKHGDWVQGGAAGIGIPGRFEQLEAEKRQKVPYSAQRAQQYQQAQQAQQQQWQKQYDEALKAGDKGMAGQIAQQSQAMNNAYLAAQQRQAIAMQPNVWQIGANQGNLQFGGGAGGFPPLGRQFQPGGGGYGGAFGMGAPRGGSGGYGGGYGGGGAGAGGGGGERGGAGSLSGLNPAALTKLLGQYQAAQTQAKNANEKRYQQIIGSLREGMNKGENLYQEILRGHRGRQESSQMLGAQAKADIGDLYAQKGAQADQDLVRRGLSNTTVRPAIQRGLTADQAKEENRLADQLRRERIGLTGEQLSFQERYNAANMPRLTDITGVMERRTDAYPDMQQMLQLLQQAGARRV